MSRPSTTWLGLTRSCFGPFDPCSLRGEPLAAQRGLAARPGGCAADPSGDGNNLHLQADEHRDRRR
jgi:hypothetical protein